MGKFRLLLLNIFISNVAQHRPKLTTTSTCMLNKINVLTKRYILLTECVTCFITCPNYIVMLYEAWLVHRVLKPRSFCTVIWDKFTIFDALQ